MYDVATIPALETPYAGRLFRSRLEARWAVFYSTIGIPWMYEPEGFELTPELWYLPDFYLPTLGAYIEIKPTHPTELESRKARLLAIVTRSPVYVFFGQPGYHIDGGYPYGQIASDGAHMYDGVTLDADGQPWQDNNYTWCICPCGAVGIAFDGRAERIGCGRDHENKTYGNSHPRLLQAYDRANRARFTTGGSC